MARGTSALWLWLGVFWSVAALAGALLNLQYKIVRIDKVAQLSSAIRLRFPEITSVVGVRDLLELYLPKYQSLKEPLETYAAVDSSNGATIGAIHYNPRTGEVEDLTVDEKCRRLGLATALMAHVVAEQTLRGALQQPAPAMNLRVVNKNKAARKLYESVGFRVAIDTPNFYHKDLFSSICPPILIRMVR